MKKNDPYKNTMNYVIFIVLGIILFNIFILPMFSSSDSEMVDYGTFLDDIESGKVQSVEVQDKQIIYTHVNDETYVTSRMDDPDLVNRLYDANITFTEVVQKDSSPFLTTLFVWGLPLILLFFVFSRFLRRASGGKGSSLMNVGVNKVKIKADTKISATFDDVAGQDEAKEALQEIIDFLHDPKKYTEIGAKMPKGVLLVGPPGTGKTLLARAVAGESKVPFFSISGSEFVEMFVGVGAARVRDLFNQAEEKAPCIIFIDELDTIGKSRSTNVLGSNDEREQTLNQLLAEMDGFDADKGIIVLAATNRPDTLDRALLRAGRFDRRIPVELPNLNGRVAILNVHAKKVKMAEDVDLTAVAKSTPGASGADLANIINESALRAVKQGRREVIQKDLEYAVEIVIAGYEKKNAVIPQKDRLRIAYHEIGHALVAAKQSNSAPVHKITIIPRTSGSLGYTMQIEEEDRVLLTKEQALSKITTLMGGRAAEEIIFQSITSGAANDSQQATKIARAMVTRFGMSEEFGMMALETVNNPYLSDDTSLLVSTETASKIDQEILTIIKCCYEEAKHILEENKEDLHRATEVLLDKETMSGKEFMEIISNKSAVQAM